MKINPFEIPKRSALVENNKRTFKAKLQRYPRNMPPIVLKGSSTNPDPTFMEKKK